jgi:phage gp36-like protein
MATYASSSDLQNLIGGSDDLVWLTDPTNTTTDSAAVTAALTTATAIIDSHALGTPGATGTAGALWSSTPSQALYCCAWIALYLLYVQIRREEPPTHVKAMYDFWVGAETGQLTLLRQGKVSWYVDEPPAAQNVGTVWAFTASSTARTDNPRRTMRDSLDLL